MSLHNRIMENLSNTKIVNNIQAFDCLLLNYYHYSVYCSYQAYHLINNMEGINKGNLLI
jgi:hypothetical protein